MEDLERRVVHVNVKFCHRMNTPKSVIIPCVPCSRQGSHTFESLLGLGRFSTRGPVLQRDCHVRACC